MKFAYLCLPFASLAEADECQDFCVRSLGDIRCTRGSYCKSNGLCHSLQWTDDSQVAICVFGESTDCSDAHPVSCSDAQSSPITTTVVPSSTVSGRSVARAIANDGHSHHEHHGETPSNSTHSNCGHSAIEGALRGSHGGHREDLDRPGALWARRTRIPLLRMLCSPVGTPITCCGGPAHNETRAHGSHNEGDHAHHSDDEHHHHHAGPAHNETQVDGSHNEGDHAHHSEEEDHHH